MVPLIGQKSLARTRLGTTLAKASERMRIANPTFGRIAGRIVACAALLAAGALVPSYPALAATTWVVDRASGSCSPTGPGTAAVPFCSIQSAAQVAFPGDTVLVKPATYREQITPPASGLAAAPITYRASAPGVVILGTLDLSDWYGWVQASSGIWKRSFQYMPRQVFVDGVRLRPAASLSDVDDFAFFYNNDTQTLYIDIGGGNPGSGHTVEAGAFTYGFNIVNQRDLVIEGFTLRRQNSMGVRTYAAAGVTIRNLEITSPAAYGVKVEASTGPVTVEGCNVSDSLSNGVLVLDTSQVTVRGNIVHDNAYHGISLQGTNDSLVAGNTCYRNIHPTRRSATGIDINDGSEYNTISGNSTYNNQDSGIEIYDGSDHNVVARNVSWDNGDHGFDSSGADHTTFVSNTSFSNYKDGFSIENGIGIVLYNNIAVDNGLQSGEYNLYVDPLALEGFDSDFNLFWNSRTQDSIKYDDTHFGSTSAYSAATGFEAHGLGEDPKFIDVSKFDLRLAPGSPAIDSADAGASGFQQADHDGLPPEDDPTVVDTGRGETSFSDRGAYENDPAPNVSLAVSPPIGTIDLSVEADASLSRTYDGTAISSFRFDFGDGTVIGPQLSPLASHTYSAPGNYTVTVYATDRATASATARVNALDRAPSVVLILTPSPANPQIVTIDASHSSDDASTPIVSYTFDFGDGTTAGPQDSPVAVHKYRTKGEFRISVTVTDTAGKTASASVIVNTRDRFSSLRFAAYTSPRLRTRSRSH